MVRACEFFLYSKQDRDAVYKCMERGYQFPEVTSWIRASKEDFRLVKEIGMKETGIPGKLLRLPYLHEAENDKKTGHGPLSERHQGVPLRKVSAPDAIWRTLPEPIFTDMWFPSALSSMKLMEEYKIPIKNPKCLRYHGLRRELSRRRNPQERARNPFMRSIPMACPTP